MLYHTYRRREAKELGFGPLPRIWRDTFMLSPERQVGLASVFCLLTFKHLGYTRPCIYNHNELLIGSPRALEPEEVSFSWTQHPAEAAKGPFARVRRNFGMSPQTSKVPGLDKLMNSCTGGLSTNNKTASKRPKLQGCAINLHK